MHLFRKYFNNRGSALFMVISTMTAVMISCMAMYFSVISSRSTQYVVFNENQAKQSATSISEALLAGMMDGTQADFKNLVDKMWKLPVGEKITTTNGNGFAAFNKTGTGSDEDKYLGAYMLEITRVSENTFDIIVTSSMNGVTETYHNVIDLEVNDDASAPPAPSQVFAATGYVPNDVYVDGGAFVTDMFFDNEQTIFNAYGKEVSGKNMDIGGNLATGGSLTVHGYLNPTKTKSLTFAVRGTYTANFNQPVIFAPSPYEKSLVLIGGDCVLNENNGFSNANVYILGDLIVAGNPDFSSSNYFVSGDVILKARQTPWGLAGFWNNLKNVYANGIVDATKNTNGGVNGGLSGSLVDGKGKTAKSWTDKTSEEGVMSISEMVKLLNEKTQSNVYYKWVINDSAPSKDAYVKELNEKAGTAVHKTLEFCQGYDSNNKAAYHTVPTIVLKYGENGERGCIIDDVIVEKGNHSFNHCTLVIDTGEDEDNVYTIRVKPNRDFDGDNVNETFCWNPYRNDSESVVSVLVKGRGSVVVDIPEGVVYQDVWSGKFMHYGWYLLAGGVPDTTKVGSGETWVGGKGKNYYESQIVYDMTKTSGMTESFPKYVHSTCKSGDGCTYSEEKSSETCSLHTEKDMMNVKCSVHGNVSSYCPECHPEKKNKHEGECVNHVGRKEIDAYLATNSTMKSRMTGSDGKIIYPTTNIFLVSCDESADIRLSIYEDGTSFMLNTFCGYVYAPYMTFKAYTTSLSSGVRLMGGMTVSDYIIDDCYLFIGCWPEKMPTELMSSECLKNPMDGISSRGWKINLTGH